MTNRRRLVQQLPPRIQTDYRKKQFAATVDQLFQPGHTDLLTGYIGRRPAYYSADDLYIAEPTADRQAHQLEAVMVSRDGTGNVTDILSYDDFVNYLVQNNGIVTDHNRLFQEDCYTWSPPVDLDKLNNYQSYFWFGDDPTLLPQVTIASHPLVFTGNASQTEFGIPDRAGGLPASADTIMVTVDGAVTQRWEETDNATVLFASAPSMGATIKVYRYGDLTEVVSGNAQFDPTIFGASAPNSLTSGMRLLLRDALFDLGQNRSFWIENVGTSITLVPAPDAPYQLSSSAQFVTIARTSADQNMWSRRNYWVHKDAFSWAGVSFDSRAAQRPIIEFIPNIELVTYGSHRITDITCKISGSPHFGPDIYTRALNEFISNFDREAFETQPWVSSAIIQIPVANINTIGEEQPAYTAPGDFHGSIYLDAQHVLEVGDRVLVTANPDSPFNNCILAIDSLADPQTQEPFYFATVVHTPSTGDIITVGSTGLVAWDMASEGFDTVPFETTTGAMEYYFDGTDWILAQSCEPGVEPLFQLYDANGVAQSSLPSSTFTGNRIFGYAVGVGANDTVLQRPLAYNNAGEILFSNDLATVRATSSLGIPTGYQWFKVNDPAGSYLANGWIKASLTTAQTKDATGVWSIPQNLSFNPDNAEVGTIARSQWWNQFSQIVANQSGLVGEPYALNTYRDTLKDRSKGLGIIQNESALLKAMLLASDERFDFFSITRYIDSEYARFRRKFYQQISNVSQSGIVTKDDPYPKWVLAILDILKATKTADSPFFGSTVAGGNYFIPPTPATMGLMPCVAPEIVVDETYSQPITLIVGHDGSRTPATNDYRDQVLLALEQMIYDAIPAQFKSGALPAFAFDTYRAGWARAYDPSKNFSTIEIATLMRVSFIRWSQINNFDYATNSGYIAADPFTWNYNGVADFTGAPVAGGNWRAIYRYFYDTDRPHVAPWEMLGFASKPAWFDAEYGQAPYTSGNTYLWNDIRDGRIRRGVRAGLDANYARPLIYSILPVDESGDLLNPVQAGLIPRAPTSRQASANWIIGDHGPVENLWINSPSYGFAKAQAAFLMRPAEWVEKGWATQDLITVNGQTINAQTGDRPRSAAHYVHGETYNGVQVVKLGIQQWIVDVLASQGLSASILGGAVRGLGVQLAHKMAGYTQRENLRLRSDTFDILPSENVEVVYYEPAPFRTTAYSNVIIEWTGAGWSVVGYDSLTNTFKTLQGDASGPKSTISLGPNPAIYPWRTGVSYQTGQLVDYKGNIYRCLVTHKAGPSFNAANWSPATDVVLYPHVQVCNRTNGLVVEVPYGTVFTTTDEVANFIRDYMRWLTNEGWIFDTLDPVTRQVQDWNMMVRQFLEWTQIKYAPGNFLALAPGASVLKFYADHGQSYSMLTGPAGTCGLINRHGRPMPPRNVSITRDGGRTDIVTNSNDLAGARISLGEIEHIVLISNTTIFNDVLYDPLYNARVDRLYMIANRVADWTGRREAAGYIILDNDIMPSFAKAEEDIHYAFDIELSEDATLREYARHVIGYQSRPYLDNLLVDDTEQFEFYQGMIQTKGTAQAFSTLARSRFIEQQQDIAFLEEWALRLSDFGATTKDMTLTFALPRESIRTNPQQVEIATQSSSPSVITLSPTDARWIDFPLTAQPFPYVSALSAANNVYGAPPFAFNPFDNPNVPAGEFQPMIPNAGYVRTNEADLVCFNIRMLETLYDAAKSSANYMRFGTRIWTYDRGDGSFDLLSAFYVGLYGTSNNAMTKIETINEDSTLPFGRARVTFATPHFLTASDVGLNVVFTGLTGTTVDMEGVTKITAVDSATSVIVSSAATVGYDYTKAGILGYTPPDFLILRSLHFANNPSAQSFWSRLMPSEGQLIYIDDDGTGRWIVYRWDDTQRYWVVHRQQPPKMDSSRLVNPMIFDLSVSYTSEQMTPNPVTLKEITVLDPVVGLLPGAAMREMSYVLDYDPARYDSTYGDLWGAPQVGQLWWDLSTCRFLVTETDTLDNHDDTARLSAEMAYRTTNWGNLAPASSMDVYEWTRSLDYPTAYTGVGVVRNAANPSYVVMEEYDAESGKTVVAYYYWVAGQTAVPNAPNRSISALAAATMLANPQTNDLPWIAPITPTSLILCNLEQYVNDASSAFSVAVRDTSIEGIKHAEWALMPKLDGSTVAPEAMWKALRGSLVGYDDQLNGLPSLSLQPYQRVGFGPGKTMFSGARSGMMAARRTFVQTVNDILSRRPVAYEQPPSIKALTASTPTFQNLVWRSDDPRLSYAPPPLNSFTAVVTGRKRRDALLREEVYLTLRGFNLWAETAWESLPWDEDISITTPQNPKVRLLVKNPDGEVPGWSIWEIDPTKPVTSSNPDDFLTLSHNFDTTVASYADLLLQTYTAPTRVLIQNDERASGFWTIWLYDPSQRTADANGFSFVCAQTYRTSDFWQYVNWYETGYSAANQPTVHYATIGARDLAEGKTPTNLLVQIDDIGNGTWVWTAFDGTTWNIVARQNGTIALLSALYDVTRPTYGISDYSLANIASRDGTLDLQIIVDVLRSVVLTDAELNELWFSMLHFMHAQQNMIDWAFKTSHMTIENFNEQLQQSPIAAFDNSQNLVDYINEVKPYRVKIRDFTRSVSPPIENVNAHVTDFDLPVWYDPISKSYRRLNVVKPSDAILLQTNPQYQDWYANYQKTSRDPSSPDFNPVRHFDITISFDRVGPDNVSYYVDQSQTNDGHNDWDIYPFELYSWAGDFAVTTTTRILQFYNPLDGMANYNSSTQSKVIDVDGNATTTSPIAVDGNSPDGRLLITGQTQVDYTDPTQEELASPVLDEAISMTVTQAATVGAPHQIERYNRPSGTSVTIDFVVVPATRDSVFVFFDGLRAPSDSYSVDFFTHTATVRVPDPAPSIIMVHALGVGGTTLITEHRAFDGDGSTVSFDLSQVPQGYLEVNVDGLVADPSTYLVNYKTLVFDTAPAAGSHILVWCRNFSAGGGTDNKTFAVVETQTTIPGPMTTYTIGHTTAISGGPEHVGTIVEVNGKRLRQPFTRYVTFDDTRRATPFEAVTNIDDLKAWINGSPYIGLIGQTPLTGSPEIPTGYVGKFGYAGFEDEMLWDVEGDLVLYGDDIVTNNPDLSGDAIIVNYEDHDYDVSGNQLTVLKTLEPGDELLTTTYHNADYLGIETSSFRGTLDGLYHVPRTDGDSYLVMVNGHVQARGIDYDVEDMGIGFDSIGADEDMFGGEALTRQIVLTQELTDADIVEVMGFTGRQVSADFIWHTASRLPTQLMMGLPLVDDTGAPVTATSSQGVKATFSMNRSWDMSTWRLVDAGKLINPIYPSDETISVEMNPFDLAVENMNRYAFALPPKQTGVLWVEGERIEYTLCSVDGNVATLGSLRRATQGTSLGGERRARALYEGDGGTMAFALQNADTSLLDADKTVEVMLIENGQKKALRLGVHYTVAGTGSTFIVTFFVPPSITEVVSLGQTYDYYHPAGTLVFTDNPGIVLGTGVEDYIGLTS